MTIRNLDAVFRPHSVVLIGASRRERSVGAVVARNLAGAGFGGPLWVVHPEGAAFQGFTTVSRAADLPETPDLAVLATPPDAVAPLIAELGARGVRGAVVITAGFGESQDAAGHRRQRAMLEAARPYLLRIIGPNCVGIATPAQGLNASFAHIAPAQGSIAFVTQSGAVLTAVLDWAQPRGIGFSHLVSLGDMADIDFGDMLDYLAADADTRAILLYIEAVTHARKFMSAARAAARMKPVIAIKAGRHAEGAKAAASHTGALAGMDAAYDAAFRRAGIVRVGELDELFDAVETLARARMPAGDRVAILTNGGGIGVMATDALIERGGHLAELSPATLTALERVLPRTWSRGNPVDIIGDADGPRYARAIEAVGADPGVDALLVLNCPTAIASPVDAAEATIAALGSCPAPVFASWVGGAAATPARARLSAARVPSYETPAQAVRGLMTMVDYRRGQANLMRVPPMATGDGQVDRARAEDVIAEALEAGREWLDEPSAKAVLSAYGIPVVESAVARDAAAAADIATRMGGRVALKILSPDITHKTDVGGVALGLAPADIAAAAQAMCARVAVLRPEARLTGFTVSPMVRVADGFELILGAVDDAQFGPLVLFGQGGTAVEVVADRALALPPLDAVLARDLIERTRVARLLAGYRGRPPANIDAIVRALVAIGRLVAELPQVTELDINPFLVDAKGGVALDARIRVGASTIRGADRLSIRPYPHELERMVSVRDGRRLVLRPVRPEDEPAFRRAFARLDPGDVRLRFHGPLRALSPEMAARLTQIDYDREMAFVLIDDAPAGAADIHGVARLHADPDNVAAEYAIIVQSEDKGRGLGTVLMTELIAHAKRRGLRQVFGFVLRANGAMLTLCRELGFRLRPDAESADVIRVELDL